VRRVVAAHVGEALFIASGFTVVETNIHYPTNNTVPRNCVTDGGYASLANLEHAQKQGVVNIVFNKIVGSLKSVASSVNMETRLKKWRSGIEANISNLKRGYGLRRCSWKGEVHFRAKVLWSAIAYNIRVMTGAVLARL